MVTSHRLPRKAIYAINICLIELLRRLHIGLPLKISERCILKSDRPNRNHFDCKQRVFSLGRMNQCNYSVVSNSPRHNRTQQDAILPWTVIASWCCCIVRPTYHLEIRNEFTFRIITVHFRLRDSTYDGQRKHVRGETRRLRFRCT